MSKKLSFLLMTIVLLGILAISGSISHADDTTGSGQDRYCSDRFIFLGWLYNKPLIASITFNRGYSKNGKFNYIAEFEGYLLFADQWHNLKNGNYLETNQPFILEEIPQFEPCIVAWKEKFKTGAVNYDLQEVSFLLQFRDLKWVDESGRSPDFLIKTGVGEATMQFQGAQIPGKLIYQTMNLTGYNRLAHNFNHLKRRKFEQFFLVGQDNDILILRHEHEADRISGQWVESNRAILVDSAGNANIIPGGLEIRWTGTERENKPESPFRIYPIAWELSVGLLKDKISLVRTASFYWFYYGLSGVKGVYKGRLIMGLAEIIRGK